MYLAPLSMDFLSGGKHLFNVNNRQGKNFRLSVGWWTGGLVGGPGSCILYCIEKGYKLLVRLSPDLTDPFISIFPFDRESHQNGF